MRIIYYFIITFMIATDFVVADDQCTSNLWSSSQIESIKLYVADGGVIQYPSGNSRTLMEEFSSKAAFAHLYSQKLSNLSDVLSDIEVQNYESVKSFYFEQLAANQTPKVRSELAFALGVYASLDYDLETESRMALEVLANTTANNLAYLWAIYSTFENNASNTKNTEQLIKDFHKNQKSPFWQAWSAYELAKLSWTQQITSISGAIQRPGKVKYATTIEANTLKLPFDDDERKILDLWLYAGEQLEALGCQRFVYAIFQELADVSRIRYNHEDAYDLYRRSLVGIEEWASMDVMVQAYSTLIKKYKEDLFDFSFRSKLIGDGRRTVLLNARAKPLSDKDYISRIISLFSDVLNNHKRDVPEIAWQNKRQDLLESAQGIFTEFIRSGVKRAAGGEEWISRYGEYNISEFTEILTMIRTFYRNQDIDDKQVCVQDMWLELDFIKRQHENFYLDECPKGPDEITADQLADVTDKGYAALKNKEFSVAQSIFEELQALSREADQPYYESAAIMGFGSIEEQKGDYRKALQLYAQAFLAWPGAVVVALDRVCARQESVLCVDDWFDRLQAGNADIIR
ncbi:hypothetical protein [Kordiimonas aquimaris]|uniref:hypothetical protein n=1 Tax=Kordiimonas aquimaris TaxID=707591 RepID=UPI0021CFB8A9|nr:hypothetical protein [Kordiimonas aquimaris]